MTNKTKHLINRLYREISRDKLKAKEAQEDIRELLIGFRYLFNLLKILQETGTISKEEIDMYVNTIYKIMDSNKRIYNDRR